MDLLEHAICDIDGKELTTVSDFSIDDSDDTTPVKTMTRRRRPIGVQRGVPDFTGTMKVFIPRGTAGEVDWNTMHRTKSLHVLTYEEDDGGLRWSLEDFHVTSMSKAFTSDGGTTFDVSWRALDHYQAP